MRNIVMIVGLVPGLRERDLNHKAIDPLKNTNYLRAYSVKHLCKIKQCHIYEGEILFKELSSHAFAVPIVFSTLKTSVE
jgi:hypothetical protein